MNLLIKPIRSLNSVNLILFFLIGYITHRINKYIESSSSKSAIEYVNNGGEVIALPYRRIPINTYRRNEGGNDHWADTTVMIVAGKTTNRCYYHWIKV